MAERAGPHQDIVTGEVEAIVPERLRNRVQEMLTPFAQVGCQG